MRKPAEDMGARDALQRVYGLSKAEVEGQAGATMRTVLDVAYALRYGGVVQASEVVRAHVALARLVELNEAVAAYRALNPYWERMAMGEATGQHDGRPSCG